MKRLLCLILLTAFSTGPCLGQSSQELWNELEVAMDNQSLDKMELQAFQADIANGEDQRLINDFVEQSISTGMAGIKKKETPVVKKKRQRGFNTTLLEAEPMPRANKTLYSKKNFKAPRQRSR